MKMLSNTKAELKKAYVYHVYQKDNIVNSLKKNCAYEMNNL